MQCVLEVSKQATQSVGQEYTMVTFHLGVAQKAFKILAKSSKVWKSYHLNWSAPHNLFSFWCDW